MKTVLNILGVMGMILCVTGPVSAANFNQITDLGTSAEMIGISNIEGYSTSAAGVFDNPASLYRIKRGSAAAFATTIINEINYRNVAIGGETPYGTIALGYMEAVVEKIPHTGKVEGSNRFFVEDYFDYKSSLFKLAYAKKLNQNWAAGATYTHFVNSFWEVSGSGDNIDLGLIYIKDKYEISFSIHNFLTGQKVTFQNNDDGQSGEEVILQQWVLGAKYALTKHLDGYAQWRQKLGENLWAGALDYRLPFAPYFDISAGFKQFLVFDKTRQTFTLGLGLNLGDIKLNYAYEKGDFYQDDGKNYFSASIRL